MIKISYNQVKLIKILYQIFSKDQKFKLRIQKNSRHFGQ